MKEIMNRYTVIFTEPIGLGCIVRMEMIRGITAKDAIIQAKIDETAVVFVYTEWLQPISW